MVMIKYIAAVAFIVLGPFIGAIVQGIDRKITARMQGRVGPPILQPIYDVKKLFAKEDATVNGVMDFYIILALFFAVFSGVIFFMGGNLLLAIFVLTLSTLFVIVAAYSARSPYSDLGAEREALQVMCYEPLMVLMPVAIFLMIGSFEVSAIVEMAMPLIVYLPLIFIALIFILTIKLRKSPFDLSTSHHAHQELVKGMTTEMSGKTFAAFEIMEWYETVIFFGFIGMFFVSAAWWSWLVAIGAIIVCYLLAIIIDNNFARVKWQTTLKWSWAITLFLFVANIAVMSLF